MAHKSRSTRTKKPSAKVKNGDEWSAVDAAQKWCKIFCEEDNKTHTVSSRSLEPEDSEVLRCSDLQKGTALLWKVQGKQYSTTLLAVYDSKPTSSSVSKSVSKRKISNNIWDEESSSSEAEECVRVRPKKLKSVEKVYGVSSESDDDDQSSKKEVISGPTIIDSGHELESTSQESTKQCVCKEEFAELYQTVISLQTSIASVNSKLDLVYHTVKKSRTLEKLVGHSTPSSSTSSSEQFSDIEVKGDQKTFFSEAGVDLLAIRAMNPIKYSLALLDALFSDQSNCFSRGRRGTKQELPQEKVKLIQASIDKKYGPGTYVKNEHDINKRCNQKCIDVFNKLKRQKLAAKEGSEAK